MLQKEQNYAFRKRMLEIHTKDIRENNLQVLPAGHEISLRGKYSSVKRLPDEHIVPSYFADGYTTFMLPQIWAMVCFLFSPTIHARPWMTNQKGGIANGKNYGNLTALGKEFMERPGLFGQNAL